MVGRFELNLFLHNIPRTEEFKSIRKRMPLSTERRRENGERKNGMRGNLRERAKREEERAVAEWHTTFHQGQGALEGGN